MKVVINKCYGGFSISKKALFRLRELGSVVAIKYINDFDEHEIELDMMDMFHVCWEDEWRTDPLLIQVVDELGREANGRCAKLKIVEIPDDIEWYIDDYDGLETVHEKHESWG